MTTRESVSDPLHLVIVQPTANSTTFGWEQGLESLGHRVTVLTRSGKLQFQGRPSAELYVLPNMSWTSRAAARSRLFHEWIGECPRLHDVRDAMEELRPDLALIRAEGARSMLIASELSRRGIPWLLWQEKLPPLVRRWGVLRRLGLEPAASFTVLDSRPGGVAETTPEGGLERISYAVPEWSMPVALPSVASSGVLKVLVVASFKNHAAKRQWMVLDAAAEAGLLDGRMRFTFIGYGGPQHEGHRRVVERMQRHGVEHLVEIRAGEPFAQMATVYDEHDLVVLPSPREQFGMTVIEAMGRARPIIISDAVGAKGCVNDGVTGLIFRSGDIGELGAAMRRFVDEPALAVVMGRAAHEFTALHLDQRRIAEDILRLAGLR
jgi:glycosyltransferase involved in cell wall biosynthesis